MTPPAIYVRPAYREFGPGQEPDLAAALDEAMRHTLTRDAGGLDDLRMAPDGRLGGGYRYTATGLKQVCSILGPGLYQAVVDLAGGRRDADSDRDQYALEAAAAVYNRFLRLRAARLADQQLILNVRDRLVDGVLGPRYVLVENAQVLERAGEAAAARPGDLRFRAAVLSGRRLLLRYVAAEPLCAARPDDPLHGGLHFVNSEIGGESTFRVALLLWRRFDDSYALDQALGGRRVHAGKKFAEKLARAFARAAAAPQDPAFVARALKRAAAARLLPPGDASEEAVAAWSAGAAARLATAEGVPARIAQRAVAVALRLGAYGVAAAAAPPAGGDPARRTEYDLFGALTHAGRALYATAKEAVERAAHGVLLGRVKLR